MARSVEDDIKSYREMLSRSPKIQRSRRLRDKRIARQKQQKLANDQKMRYTPKERAVYRKALRFGRSLKAGGGFKQAPGIKFDGGRVAVMRDTKGNVHVRANSSNPGSVRALGPRGVKSEANLTSSIGSNWTVRALKTRDNLLSITGKGTYKHGSTGSKGG